MIMISRKWYTLSSCFWVPGEKISCMQYGRLESIKALQWFIVGNCCLVKKTNSSCFFLSIFLFFYFFFLFLFFPFFLILASAGLWRWRRRSCRMVRWGLRWPSLPSTGAARWTSLQDSLSRRPAMLRSPIFFSFCISIKYSNKLYGWLYIDFKRLQLCTRLKHGLHDTQLKMLFRYNDDIFFHVERKILKFRAVFGIGTGFLKRLWSPAETREKGTKTKTKTSFSVFRFLT